MNKIKSFIANLGHPFTTFIIHLGGITRMLFATIYGITYPLRKFNLILQELYFSGVKSIILIIICGWFVGMVLGLQGYNTLSRFGSVSMLGSVVALSLLRELGPVLTAILFASRAGSGMTAEIGLMKATEQIEALSVMAVSPIKRLASSKFIGGIISVPLLTAIFNTAGILGGYFVGVIMLNLDRGSFWSQMQNSVNLHEDVINGIIKSFVFGVAVTIIAIYQGFIAKPTATGVSNATTYTIVISSVSVLALDFILTALMF